MISYHSYCIAQNSFLTDLTFQTILIRSNKGRIMESGDHNFLLICSTFKITISRIQLNLHNIIEIIQFYLQLDAVTDTDVF